jgi:hypothetical protein
MLAGSAIGCWGASSGLDVAVLLSLSLAAALALAARNSEIVLGRVMQMTALNRVINRQSNKLILWPPDEKFFNKL